jgi:DNA-binding response OmpR family regulator
MKILFIEDDFFIADMYVRALKRAGHDVEIINDGSEALKKAKETVYDVILLDIMLPEKTGVEILEELRGPKGEGMPLTKIIVTTNFDEPDEDRARLEQMADGYLIKADVTPSKLVGLVEQVTAKSEK